MSENPFTKVACLPMTIKYGRVTKMGDNELVLFARLNLDSDEVDANKSQYGIYKYNTLSNEGWVPWIKYKSGYNPYPHNVIFDEVNQQLLVYNDYTTLFVDINTHEITKITEDVTGNFPEAGAGFALVKDTPHFVGGWGDNRHIRYFADRNHFEELDKIDGVSTIYAPGLLYLKSKNSLLLIGGYTKASEPDINFRICSLDTMKWRMILNVKFSHYHVNAVLTQDEKYAIIRCAFDNLDNEIGDRLYILKIGNENDMEYELRESDVRLPAKTGRIEITGNKEKDELLVHGFIKMLFGEKEFIESGFDVPSVDIIGVIETFATSEMLHYFSFDDAGNNHYMIPLSSIF